MIKNEYKTLLEIDKSIDVAVSVLVNQPSVEHLVKAPENKHLDPVVQRVDIYVKWLNGNKTINNYSPKWR